jgi:hypothetical protein
MVLTLCALLVKKIKYKVLLAALKTQTKIPSETPFKELV